MTYPMSMYRNRYFLAGILLILLGIQFRMIDSFVLNESATRALARIDKSAPVADNSGMSSILMQMYPKPVKRIEATVMRRLQSYYWPGNVRELENIIERGVILTEGKCLQLDDSFDLNTAPLPDQQKTLGEVEQEIIQVALEKSGWKIEGQNGAARRLAVAPSTLRERIKKYGLQRHQQTNETSIEPIYIQIR